MKKQINKALWDKIEPLDTNVFWIESEEKGDPWDLSLYNNGKWVPLTAGIKEEIEMMKQDILDTRCKCIPTSSPTEYHRYFFPRNTTMIPDVQVFAKIPLNSISGSFQIMVSSNTFDEQKSSVSTIYISKHSSSESVSISSITTGSGVSFFYAIKDGYIKIAQVYQGTAWTAALEHSLSNTSSYTNIHSLIDWSESIESVASRVTTQYGSYIYVANFNEIPSLLGNYITQEELTNIINSNNTNIYNTIINKTKELSKSTLSTPKKYADYPQIFTTDGSDIKIDSYAVGAMGFYSQWDNDRSKSENPDALEHTINNESYVMSVMGKRDKSYPDAGYGLLINTTNNFLNNSHSQIWMNTSLGTIWMRNCQQSLQGQYSFAWNSWIQVAGQSNNLNLESFKVMIGSGDGNPNSNPDQFLLSSDGNIYTRKDIGTSAYTAANSSLNPDNIFEITPEKISSPRLMGNLYTPSESFFSGVKNSIGRQNIWTIEGNNNSGLLPSSGDGVLIKSNSRLNDNNGVNFFTWIDNSNGRIFVAKIESLNTKQWSDLEWKEIGGAENIIDNSKEEIINIINNNVVDPVEYKSYLFSFSGSSGDNLKYYMRALPNGTLTEYKWLDQTNKVDNYTDSVRYSIKVPFDCANAYFDFTNWPVSWGAKPNLLNAEDSTLKSACIDRVIIDNLQGKRTKPLHIAITDAQSSSLKNHGMALFSVEKCRALATRENENSTLYSGWNANVRYFCIYAGGPSGNNGALLDKYSNYNYDNNVMLYPFYTEYSYSQSDIQSNAYQTQNRYTINWRIGKSYTD